MKKKLFVISLILICIATAAYGTLSYFSYQDKATNVITAGNVKIELLESSLSQPQPKAYEENVSVMPAAAVSKIVEVKNTGNNSAWIRVSVEKTIELFENSDGEIDVSLISLNIDNQNWIEKDGYYYYLNELKSGESTKPLFTAIEFSKNMKNEYQKSKAVINITAQATQKANNANTVFEALGWPKSK